MLPGVLTLTATKRLLGAVTSAGPKGGCARYCGHRASVTRLMPGHRPLPIDWAGGTDLLRLQKKPKSGSDTGGNGYRFSCFDCIRVKIRLQCHQAMRRNGFQKAYMSRQTWHPKTRRYKNVEDLSPLLRERALGNYIQASPLKP